MKAYFRRLPLINREPEERATRYTQIMGEPLPDSRRTVVEFFQSQGCLSCPPANDNVVELIGQPGLLILTYEVTYWDHLGWKDTFGQSVFDHRQWEYAKAGGRKSVSTPQVIVNGFVDGVGTTTEELKRLIRKGWEANRVEISVEITQGIITVTGPMNQDASVLLVRYDPNTTDVPVHEGENKGSCLPHRNIVHNLSLIGYWHGGLQTFSFTRSNQGRLKGAILVQAGKGGPIVGAASF
ncbi:hypothetical protein MMC13_003232 [Lambiella insularis]|nr:hypothetical protein [Lambiella insularis]